MYLKNYVNASLSLDMKLKYYRISIILKRRESSLHPAKKNHLDTRMATQNVAQSVLERKLF